MRIHIIRHADPDYANHTITPAGHLEAKALAKRFERMGLDRIYCSPFRRAIHTARYTADATKLEPVIESWMGELEGWHIKSALGQTTAAWNVNGELVRHKQPFPQQADWSNWGPFRNRKLQQKYAMIVQQSDLFLASLGYEREGGKYRIASRSKERIAVFCHLGFGLTWLSHLLDLPLPLVWTGFWKAPSSVTTVLMDERSKEWATPRVIALGDTSHLYEAGLPVSSQGIIANFD